jgi:hypothetical protein
MGSLITIAQSPRSGKVFQKRMRKVLVTAAIRFNVRIAEVTLKDRTFTTKLVGLPHLTYISIRVI